MNSTGLNPIDSLSLVTSRSDMPPSWLASPPVPSSTANERSRNGILEWETVMTGVSWLASTPIAWPPEYVMFSPL